MSDHHHDDHGFAHPAPVKMLLAVFFALIFLTILTVVTAGQIPKPFGIWVAMSIATLKGALVCLFFMHMYWDKPLNVVAFLSSLLFVSLFIGMTLMDTGHNLNTVEEFPREYIDSPLADEMVTDSTKP